MPIKRLLDSIVHKWHGFLLGIVVLFVMSQLHSTLAFKHNAV